MLKERIHIRYEEQGLENSTCSINGRWHYFILLSLSLEESEEQGWCPSYL